MNELSIGSYVREARKAQGLTQAQLAAIAGVGLRFLSELERDKATLRLDRVNQVLGVFGKQVGVVEATRAPVWEKE